MFISVVSFKNNDFIQHFLLFRVNLSHHSHACSTSDLHQQHHTHASCYYHEWQQTDPEEKKSLNKVVIFVFFAHKKYSHSFIKLWLNHWCHMDYFIDVLTTFLCLDFGSSLAVYMESQKTLGFVFRRWTKVLQVWTNMRVSNTKAFTMAVPFQKVLRCTI